MKKFIQSLMLFAALSVPWITQAQGDTISTFPFSCDFESLSDASLWSYTNSSNGWFIGNVTNNTDNGTKSLYISDANGTNNNYSGSACVSYAYLTFQISTPGQYALSFDWKCAGESTYDFLRVAVAPDSVALPSVITNWTATAVPSGFVAVDGGGKLNLSGTTWNTNTAVITVPVAGVYRLLFVWRNDASVYNQPPAAVDNIIVTELTCPSPINLTLSSLTENTATLTWTPVGNETSWKLVLGDQTLYTTTNSHSFSNLMPNTSYDAAVYAVCGAGDTSFATTLNFRTPCVALSSLPYFNDFEDEPYYLSGTTTYAEAFPNCWTRINDATNTYNYYPYINTTSSYVHSGTKGMYWYHTTSAGYAQNEYAVLPPVDATVYSIEDLTLSFYAKTTSTSYHPQPVIGVMSNPNDTSTFVPVYSFSATEVTTTWTNFVIPFSSYSGNGNYIAIKWHNPGSSWYLAIDDIYLTDAWCNPIDGDITATSGTDEVTLSWNGSGASSYEVFLGNDTVQGVTDTFYTFTQLTPNTNYEYGVAVECADGNSFYIFGDIYTHCVPFDTLPYIQDFEALSTGSTAAFDNCWSKGTNSSTAFPYVNNYTGESGYNHGLYGYCGGASYWCYAVMPELGEDIDIADLELSFDMRKGSTTATYGGHLIVAVLPTDVWSPDSTYDTIAVLDETSNLYVRKYVDFSDYEGSNRRIAFIFINDGTTYNSVYIDNIDLHAAPTCLISTNLTTDSVSYDFARVTWENTSESVMNYYVYYSTEPVFDLDTAAYEIVQDTVADLTMLQEETNYYWTVVADCGGGDLSIIPVVQQFRTLRDCGEDYVNIVGTIGNGSSSSYTYFTYNYTSYPVGHSGNIFTAEELGEFGLMAGANISSISLHAGATGCTIPNLKIYAGTIDTNQFATFADTVMLTGLTLVYDSSLTTTAYEWATIHFDTALYYDGASNLVFYFRRDGAPTANGNFYYTSTSPNYRSFYGYKSSTSTANPSFTRAYYRVDMRFDMCAEVPSCRRPENVNIVSLLDTSVTITWNGDANIYQCVVGEYGFNPDTATNFVTVTDTIALVTGLEQNTGYDLYVRSICDASLISDWTIVHSFRTPCSPQTLPYSENFENYGTGSAENISPCWAKGTNSSTAYPYPYSSNAVNGSRSLYFYSYSPSSESSTAYYSYAVLPLMNAPVDTLMVDFSVRRYSTTTTYYTTYLLVGVMTDPEDITTFVAVDTVDLQTAPALSVHNFEVNLDSYQGNGNYIAFYAPAPPTYGTAAYCYNYVYLDDITVDYIPNCRRILDVNVNTVSETNASLYWSNTNATGIGYEIEYGPEGFNLGTGTSLTTIDTFITISNLLASTGYDFYVRALCSSTESSPWSFVTNFRTLCGLYSLPYVEDFENYGTGSTYGIDPCWTRGTNSTTAYPYPYGTNAINGSRCLYFYAYHPSTTSSTAYYSYAALPEFNVGVDSLELSFKVRRYGTASNLYTTYLLVGVMTDPDDISTFVGVDTIDLQAEPASSVHEITVTFENYSGTGTHIAIFSDVPPLYGTSTYSYSYAYVDDVNVNQISPCGHPFDLTATVTNNSITLDWTDTVNATQWQVEYGPTGFALGTGTQVNTSTKPFTITGLSTTTSYDVYVRSYCSDGSLGGTNGGIYTFVTSQVPAALPYLYNFENAAEWANWQTVSNNNVGWYRGTAESAEGNYGLYVSTDSGATCNSLHNVITNAAVYRDVDFGSTPSSFEMTFLAKSAGVNDGNYEGINVMLVDPATPVEASSSSLTTPWGTFNVVHVVRDTNWNAHTMLFDNVSGVKRVVFNWYTSTTSSHPVWQGAGAIDSISIIEQSCVRPNNTAITDVGSDFVSIQWDGDANANYLVRLREVNGTVNNDNMTTTNSITINNLTASTDYYVWVYKVCDSNNISYSAPRIEFSTTCVPYDAVDTLWEDFNAVNGTAYNTAGVLPDCWEGYSNGTNNVYMPHVTDGNTYSYSVSGNAITMTSGSATYGDTKIVRLPKFTEPVNTLTMSYWYCTESSTNGVLSVGYMTGFDYENDFVPLVSHPASTASYHSGNGAQSAGHGIYDTVSFDSVPSNALFIAFKWVYNTSFYSVCIDNIEVISTGVYCHTPEAEVTAISHDQATLNINNGIASNYEVGIKLATEPSFSDNDVQVNAGTYTFTNLVPQTAYQYRVREVCDSVTSSEWTLGNFTTDTLPCYAPTNLTADASYTSVTLDWTPGGVENQWGVHVWNTNFDTVVVANAHPVTVGGLTQAFAYSAEVKSICGGGLEESEYCDAVTFTTATCDQVTGLAVSNITATSAVLTWTGTASSYEIDYGGLNHGQGTGTIVTTNATTYTLTGLTPDNMYSVFVRAVCEPGVNGAWSSQADFTTLEGESTYYTITVVSSDPTMGSVTGGGTFAAGAQATITATANAGYEFVNWNGNISDNPYTFTVTGDATFTANFQQTQGIDVAEGETTFAVYPNPTHGSTTITLGGVSGEVTIAVVDMNGRVVMSDELSCDGDCAKTMEVAGLAQGAYFVRVSGEHVNMVKKLIVK